MARPFLGSEATAHGMAWGELQRRHVRLFRDVYVDVDAEVTAALRAEAAWLWSGRRGVIAGLAAAAMHGSRWIDSTASIDLYHGNRHRLPGLMVRSERLDPDDTCRIDDVPVTTAARTALDLGCWYPRQVSVPAIDALARATELKLVDAELLADRHQRRRGIVRARRALELADPGAQSPKESWLRTVLLDAGLPRPHTQIPVHDDFGRPVAYLDMGWQGLMVAVEYDGDHHRTQRSQYSYDIRRLEMLHRKGWIVVRVTAEDTADDVIRRVRQAIARRR